MSFLSPMQSKHRGGGTQRRSSTGPVLTPRSIATLRSIAVACSVLASAVTMLGGSPAAAQAVPVSVEHVGSIPVTSAGTVLIERTRGDVRVEGWDDPTVLVRVTARSKSAITAADMRAATSELDGFAARLVKASPSEVIITGLSPSGHRLKRFGGKRGVALTYTIRMPRTAKLILRHGIGSVEVTGLAADLNVASGVGDIHITSPLDPAASVTASATIGDVSIARGVGNGVYRQHALLGRRYSYDPVGANRHVVARVRIGSVEID